MGRSSYRNNFIRLLPEEDFAVLEPSLERVSLRSRDVIVRPNAPIAHVYFVETGQLSVLARVPQSEAIEVGMIGFEGMSDMVAGGRTTLETIAQSPCEGHRIRFADFAARLSVSLPLADLTMRWQQCIISQMAYTALSHGSFTITERLARFLLMMQDRLCGEEIPLVHEFLSWMLAVRRAGVSDALEYLRQAGCIERGRGRIRIIDRDRLIEHASGSYGRAEAEYDRLMGPLDRSHRVA